MFYIKKTTTKFTKGRDDYRPEIIVIHLADGLANSILGTFKNEDKSAHYVICRNREIWQFVDEKDTAWANGIKVNPAAKIILERPDVNPNKYSISIENEGFGQIDISDSQYEDNACLVSDIAKRWLIPLDREHVIGHYEIRADKACPRPISVDKILKMARQYNEPEKIEVLKKQVSVLEELVALWKKLKLLLNK